MGQHTPAAPNAHAEKVNKIATERRYPQPGTGQVWWCHGVGRNGDGGGFTVLSRACTLSLSPACTGCALSHCCVGVCVCVCEHVLLDDWQSGKAEKPKSVYRKRVRGAEVAARGHHNGVLDLSV